MELEAIKGIGEKTAKLFHKLNLTDTKQLLFYYPRDYEKFDAPILVDKTSDGAYFAVDAVVTSAPTVRYIKGKSLLQFKIADPTGEIRVTYFNSPYLKNTIKSGEKRIFYGMVHIKNNIREMTQPKMYHQDEYEKMMQGLLPVYSLTKGLSNKVFSKAIQNAYKLEKNQLEDFLPDKIINKHELMSFEEAIYQVHFPKTMEDLIKARRRLAYQEFLLFLYRMKKLQDGQVELYNHCKMIETAETVRLLESLPYPLTTDQKNVWEEIKADMTGEKMMSRLIQGDVGSGKTILAILSLLMSVCNGFQGAFMAPTEVLAKQHFETISEMTKQYHLPFRPCLLTGSLSAKEKKLAYKEIEDGYCNVIIGTHALIQEKVNYNNLGLVITDEQHRFGVNQRKALSEKGIFPHILVMSATPIPRTLAMILYGDLDISIIKTMPAGRIPIKNCVVNTSYRNTAYRFMEKEITKGRQVYIICPMVEASEDMQLENVLDYTKMLRETLDEKLKIGCLHGKMKPAMKNQIMNDFKDQNLDILVSTTVIEVGINVPNANVMMIENSERFGLAQLHQLRGRVGRGSEQSYCIFINGSGKEDASKRLKVLENSNDGFYIASEDMKMRGPGDMFGIRQSGSLDFKIADIYQDGDLLKDANEDINEILNNQDESTYEIINKFDSFIFLYGENSVDFTTI